MSTSASYLATLRRIPDDIVLAIAAQDFDETTVNRCVCGWALREDMARAAGVDAAVTTVNPDTVREELAKRFGGSVREWSAIWHGVMYRNTVSDIESAFVDRLDEIVLGSSTPAPEEE